MKYNRIGHSDLEVSRICLGTMTFGEQNTEAEAHVQLDYAVSQGINFIDTAEMYAVPGRKETQGLTEKYIGTWLSKRGKRDDLIIASKITGPSDGMLYIRNPLNFSRSQILEAIEGNLKRLQTDYLDIYQLHWPERNNNRFGQRGYQPEKENEWQDNFLEILQTMDELIKGGKIRYFGISNETPWGMMRFLALAEKHNLPRMISIQNPYNLLNRTFEIGMSEICMRENVGLLAYSPMAFGLLSGKYHKHLDNENCRINKFPILSRYNSDNSYEATGKYMQIAQKFGTTPARLALAFVNTRPFVHSNIIGATSMDQLREDIDSINLELTDEMISEIENVHKLIPDPAP